MISSHTFLDEDFGQRAGPHALEACDLKEQFMNVVIDLRDYVFAGNAHQRIPTQEFVGAPCVIAGGGPLGGKLIEGAHHAWADWARKYVASFSMWLTPGSLMWPFEIFSIVRFETPVAPEIKGHLPFES